MSNTITNEQLVAERGLYTFFVWGGENEKYDNFRNYWSGVIAMVAHKQFGWIAGITELGYEQVVKAYNELYSLDFFDDDSEIFD